MESGSWLALGAMVVLTTIAFIGVVYLTKQSFEEREDKKPAGFHVFTAQVEGYGTCTFARMGEDHASAMVLIGCKEET